MAVTRPGAKIVTPAVELAADALRDFNREEPLPGEGATRTLSYKQRLMRRLEMSDMALEKYYRMLQAGKDLTPEQERLFLAHQDSSRKLEATLAQLEHKDTAPEQKTDLELALDLIDRGWSVDDVLRVFSGNDKLAAQLQETLDERQ